MDKTEILQKDLNDLVKEETELTKDIKQTEELIKNKDKSIRELSTLQNSINVIQQKIENLKPYNTKIKKRLNELSEYLKGKDKTQLEAEYQNKIAEEDTLKGEIVKIEQKIALKQQEETQVSSLQNKIDIQKGRVEQLKTTRDALTRKLASQNVNSNT